MSNKNERLWALQQKQNSEFYGEGKELGEKWARDQAEPRELRRIEVARDELRRRSEWEQFFEGEDSDWCAGIILHHLIMGGDEIYGNPDCNESDEFWKSVGVDGETRCDGHFVRGFADGAAEYWAEEQRKW